MGKLFGLVGHPLGHSMSPLMHNTEFRELGLPHHYQPFELKEDELEEGIKAMRLLGVEGFNVTIPHKVSIIPMLDEVEQEAMEIGAVNTVYRKENLLIGANTDGQGYLQSLLKLTGEDSLVNKNVLVIGAGGAARAVAVSISRSGVSSMTIANRTVEKAEKLSDVCRPYAEVDAISLELANLSLEAYDIIINTTSIGMSPDINNVPIPVQDVKEGVVMSDLIYNPLETLWLTEGREKGAITANGLSMFVEQGALAFEKWLGIKPDRSRMTETVLNKLGGK
ncbi:shikimate dehydrogenase [Guptibacillus algicola]|uniref:shikimate dehydrogenase n=1 Tax=Guptibacillus algicola TaxID=225844 RepID=UPI001CD1A5F0|nr:shikimate dehydrogenase [Alkalihalobacillus algicola]MCA0986120.1 shikimate dehydrogenase [Alkalihalobacillus algicola]